MLQIWAVRLFWLTGIINVVVSICSGGGNGGLVTAAVAALVAALAARVMAQASRAMAVGMVVDL